MSVRSIKINKYTHVIISFKPWMHPLWLLQLYVSTILLLPFSKIQKRIFFPVVRRRQQKVYCNNHARFNQNPEEPTTGMLQAVETYKKIKQLILCLQAMYFICNWCGNAQTFMRIAQSFVIECNQRWLRRCHETRKVEISEFLLLTDAYQNLYYFTSDLRHVNILASGFKSPNWKIIMFSGINNWQLSNI